MRKISKIRTLQAQYERHVCLTTSPHSYEKYARALEHFMKKFPEKRGPRDYYSTDIEDYKILRLREGATPSYVRYELSVIRNFFQWMIDFHEGLIEYNPASEVRVGRMERPQVVVRPPEIYKTIFDSLEGPHATVLLFAVLTGLGPKEISRIEKKDIDFDGALLLRPRPIPLRSDILVKLVDKPEGRLFIGHKAISKSLKDAANSVGYNDIRFPDLRRFFALTLLRHGVSLASIEQLTGKRSPLSHWVQGIASSEEQIRSAMEHLPRLRGLDVRP